MNIFTGLTPTTFFVPVPRQIMDFESRLSLYFCMFNELRGEVIVRLVDIAGNINHLYDHHCLNFLIIILLILIWFV